MKLEGNDDDVKRVVRKLKAGVLWQNAKHDEEFQFIPDEWYEKHKALFEKYVIEGIPAGPGLVHLATSPKPLQVIATPDGKVWGVYMNADGSQFRKEIAEAKEAPPPETIYDANAPSANRTIAAATGEKKGKKEW